LQLIVFKYIYGSVKLAKNSNSHFTVVENYRKGFTRRLKESLNGETVRSFAERADIPQSTFNKIVTGESDPRALTILKIANAANVSLHWLIKGEGPKHVEAQDTRNNGDKGPLLPIDQDLLMMVIEELEIFRQKHNLKWDAKQKSRLITLGYDMMLAEQEKGHTAGPELLHYLMQAAS
jgi:transcriptional regulator with XRE-family HTH domain